MYFGLLNCVVGVKYFFKDLDRKGRYFNDSIKFIVKMGK